MFSEKRNVHWTLHCKSRCGKSKKSSRQWNTTVNFMSTVFYTVSFLFTLEIFTKIAKKKKKSIVQRYVRFFETWNALINRLDEIIFWRSIYFLNPESKKEYTDSIFFVFHCKGAVAMRSHCTTCVILKCISVYKS